MSLNYYNTITLEEPGFPTKIVGKLFYIQTNKMNKLSVNAVLLAIP